jgi:hypothetical protein
MNDDDLTNDLTRELHGRVDAMHGSSLGLGDVQIKARSIRRRRAATAVVGVVAAVAIIAPTAAVAGREMRGDHSLPPATQSVDPSPAPTATPTGATEGPASGVLDVSSLPTGAAPAVAYVEKGVVHLPDGTTRDEATRYPVTGLLTLQGTRIFQTRDQGKPWIEIVGYDGTRLGLWRSAWGLAVNPAHTVAAWVSPDGQVMVWNVGAMQPLPLGDPITAGTDLRISTVVGDACGPSTSGCTVYVNIADARGASSWRPWEVTESGSQQLMDGSFLSVADESESGLTIGFTSLTDSGSCSKLAGGGEFQGWSTCKHTLDAFSPDGKLVLAGPAYRDGIGDGVIAMYDASSGNLAFQRTNSQQSQSFYSQAVWEDDTHVLAPVFQANRWAIVRIGSDGSMEYAVPPVKGAMDQNPFVIATSGMS